MDSPAATADIDVHGIQGDTNRDGKVTITDAVSVVNIILNNGETAAPALENPEVVEPEWAAFEGTSCLVRTEQAGEDVPLGDPGSAFG